MRGDKEESGDFRIVRALFTNAFIKSAVKFPQGFRAFLVIIRELARAGEVNVGKRHSPSMGSI